MSCKQLSTGVLNKHADTRFAHVEVVNLDECAHTIKVRVINWTNPQHPVDLPVLTCSTAKVLPNTAQFFNTPLPCSPYRYEIRISIYDGDNVIVNCFGTTDPCFENINLEGNTVLFRDLVCLDNDDDDD